MRIDYYRIKKKIITITKMKQNFHFSLTLGSFKNKRLTKKLKYLNSIEKFVC